MQDGSLYRRGLGFGMALPYKFARKMYGTGTWPNCPHGCPHNMIQKNQPVPAPVPNESAGLPPPDDVKILGAHGI